MSSAHPSTANPYTPPSAVPAATPDPAKKERFGLTHFVVALVLVPGSVLVSAATDQPVFAILGCAAATLVALIGVLDGLVWLVRGLVKPRAESGWTTLGVLFVLLSNGFMAFIGGIATFIATFGFSRGRQLRHLGRVLLPPVGAGDAWAGAKLGSSATALLSDSPGKPGELAPPGVAEQWRENGRTEHASVGAFARLTLDLMSLGAPPELVSAANRDALDEIRHTELCFSLARALDGARKSPGAFPAAARARTLPTNRRLALATLAVDSLVDGALNEGVSARLLGTLQRRCAEPRIKAILKEIAADEGRHAAHGWDVVEWCLAEGGDAVADALSGALMALPGHMSSTLPAAAENGDWERFGIHGSALEVESFHKTRADLVERVERMLASRMQLAS